MVCCYWYIIIFVFYLIYSFLTCLFFSSPGKYELFFHLFQPSVPISLLVPLLFPHRFFSSFISKRLIRSFKFLSLASMLSPFASLTLSPFSRVRPSCLLSLDLFLQYTWSHISIFKTSYTSLLSIWLFSLFSICLSIKSFDIPVPVK